MEVFKTSISGIVIIEPQVFKDAIGFFFEWCNRCVGNVGMDKVVIPVGVAYLGDVNVVCLTEGVLGNSYSVK